MFMARPIDNSGSNYMIGIINKISKNKSIQTTRLTTSERGVIIIIINLAKYPDIIFIFPASV